MAVVDAAREIARCPLTAADLAVGIRRFNTPDMDFSGKFHKAVVFLQQVVQELDRRAKQ